MQSLEPFIIVFGAVVIAAISSGLTAAYHHARNRGHYNRGWTAGKQFAREHPDH
jgi:hypothetical protein